MPDIFKHAQLTRVGDTWPSSIRIELLRKGPDIPGPTQFRIANGKLGVSGAMGIKFVRIVFRPTTSFYPISI